MFAEFAMYLFLLGNKRLLLLLVTNKNQKLSQSDDFELIKSKKLRFVYCVWETQTQRPVRHACHKLVFYVSFVN